MFKSGILYVHCECFTLKSSLLEIMGVGRHYIEFNLTIKDEKRDIIHAVVMMCTTDRVDHDR